ncbi:PCI domain-containing protein [Neobacillus muris]|uniref:PCI domain-containing protein n=1 Tax=Neobacillus muris TaxID=2941334 RepID=UPI00203F694B|nr:PCI domain-containing protein [Neobacillus muris]
MDKELLFERVKTMITSSTKEPKYISLSTVKLADLFGVSPSEVEKNLQALIEEGRIEKKQMIEPPYYDMYLLG